MLLRIGCNARHIIISSMQEEVFNIPPSRREFKINFLSLLRIEFLKCTRSWELILVQDIFYDTLLKSGCISLGS